MPPTVGSQVPEVPVLVLVLVLVLVPLSLRPIAQYSAVYVLYVMYSKLKKNQTEEKAKVVAAVYTTDLAPG